MLRHTTAWMGGSRPNPWLSTSCDERKKTCQLFREQCGYYLEAWGNLLPPSPGSHFEMARLFWNRARYDAHASYR